MVFEPFPKLARLSRECTITEKIDGTNAQIWLVDPETTEGVQYEWIYQNAPIVIAAGLHVYAGSRTRFVTPGKVTDNFGFAGWVQENVDELVKLGPGRHFGEWWGKGIQRGYGLMERRFSLFHTHGIAHKPDCVSVVPTIYQGVFDSAWVNYAMNHLKNYGSKAADGFMNPEGIVVYHTAARVAFKKTFEKDEEGKGQ